jgi:hypothetical protein
MRRWDAETLEEMTPLPSAHAQVGVCSISRFGRRLAGASVPVAEANQHVHRVPAVLVWEVGTGAIIGEFPGKAVALAWSPDGDRLAAGMEDGRLVLLEIIEALRANS